MFTVSQLKVEFPGRVLFDDISFIIQSNDRIGLTGRNGAGKTTLLRILAGIEQANSGAVVIGSGKRVGYLPQEMNFRSKGSVINEALQAFEEVNRLEKYMEVLTRSIADRIDYETEEYLTLITELHEAGERHQLLSGSKREEQTEKVLLGLGFLRTDFHRPLSEFSGGWQMRVELARILLQQPDLLLLDEPTNHLDIESIQWLESYIASGRGAVVVVSHDRAFLDNVTKRTLEINLGKMYDFQVPYSEYVVLREEQLGQQLDALNAQQKEIERVEKFIERFRYKASKAKQVQTRIRQLDKLEKQELDLIDDKAIHFQFPKAPHSGKIVLEATAASKTYNEFQVFEPVDFVVPRGERIAFVGRNGEGKTTLVRMIMDEIDFDGSLKYGHQVVAGYFAQDQANRLDEKLTVFETLEQVADNESRPKIRNLLGSFLFSGDDADKKVMVLSGGEKSRLAMARMLLTPANLLILDEPTNHLDMRAKDVLKNALLQFDGTLIIVSHDRDFLQGLTGKVFEFREGKIRQHTGDVSDYLALRKLQHLKDLEKIQSEKTQDDQEKTLSQSKIDYEQKRASEKEIRKVRTQIAKREEQIEQLEAQIQSIEDMLASPDSIPAGSSIEKQVIMHHDLKVSLAKEIDEWEDLHRQIDEM